MSTLARGPLRPGGRAAAEPATGPSSPWTGRGGRVADPPGAAVRRSRRTARGWTAAVALAAAGLLILTGCGAGSTDVVTDGTGNGRAVPTELRFEVGTVDGGTFAGDSLAGKPAVLWFWAPWCPVCQGEAPEIARAYERFGEQIQFVGVAGLGKVDEMRAFVADTGLGHFPHAVDADGALWASFGVDEQPALSFVTADGKVRTLQGRLSEGELTTYLTRLLPTA
ncbi:redoxin domain-containing protein [Frankia sp. CNm7]|uniref:Redoxin domain-containing protein n=1 Tax=Frankia nepalensis TaxID=1836974 RepID=A0A937RM44_9ACTN|nr:redoxin domain-containing protein [Frankia nepalensis]MBL7498376.1 redoxin domain-containing protein [Frankia nepalensis]MBL7516059.1 redoxin domain-containing protein [Frankia nepalensis]MBL7521498.1 redoxin domain-containing protein [Frankia nepalensis]MBL7628898.1 redoxin domain-containing protein [Frankia nepalensis]